MMFFLSVAVPAPASYATQYPTVSATQPPSFNAPPSQSSLLPHSVQQPAPQPPSQMNRAPAPIGTKPPKGTVTLLVIVCVEDD